MPEGRQIKMAYDVPHLCKFPSRPGSYFSCEERNLGFLNMYLSIRPLVFWNLMKNKHDSLREFIGNEKKNNKFDVSRFIYSQ